jgi:tellurite resistance protein TerC
MNVPPWLWLATLIALLAVLIFDLIVVGRNPREPSVRECVVWVAFYVTLAVAFAVGVFMVSGPRYSGEFSAGWLTEYGLSVDNLFVYLIIMSRFAVPRQFQQRTLFIGIMITLVLRVPFIVAGAAAVREFAWIFYLFGFFLAYTAVRLALHGEDDMGDFKDNALMRWAGRVLPMSDRYDGGRLRTTHHGRRLYTPMVIVLIAIGTAGLIFAVDSIPAIFGLTQEPYLILAANALGLMGLRQLYFLLAALLDRLVYLSVGLAVILGYIGIDLFLEALHENNVPVINGGLPVPWAPHVPIWLSLAVIVGTLATTAVASVARSASRGPSTD